MPRVTKTTYKITIFLIVLALANISIFIRTSDAVDFSENIVAVWLMDEGTGKEIRDSSGNGHTGEFFGNPEWTDGKFDKGIQFHGAPDHIEVPDPDHELTPKHITLVCWLKLDNVSGSHSILEQYDWAGDLGTYAWRTNGVALQFYVIWGTNAPNANGGTLKAKEWTHVAATYDGENIKTWINGKVAATATASRDLNPSNKSLSFGVRGDTKDTQWMEGVLDEAAIFDEALSEEEIQDIMNNGLQSSVLAVSPSGKLATAWGSIKKQ